MKKTITKHSHADLWRMTLTDLIGHVGKPHLGGPDDSRISYLANPREELERWGLDELRRSHADLHGVAR